MRLHKIIYVLWPMIIFTPNIESNEKEVATLRDIIKHKRHVSTESEKSSRLKKAQATTEKVPDDDEDKKTLAQQVIDGKYGLIQTELFSSPVKRPGIISYEVNPEVPKDNINNLGGLKPEEIWLAENHLLVLKGGGFNEKEQSGQVMWPPIDNYIAPQRQVKIPPNPKIPPPFPIQLKDGGPIEVIKGKNNTKNYSPFFNGGPFGPPFLFPFPQNVPSDSKEDQIKSNQGNLTQGNGTPPFPFLPPPGIGLYPPAIAFLPPPGNLTELDEDDPRIYYPPKYDFVYKKNYSSHVPPGPLVPGIILPPPPSFFALLENNTRTQRPNENSKLISQFKKTSKTRHPQVTNIRHKIVSPQVNNFKHKIPLAGRERKILSPIHVVNNRPKGHSYSSKSNSTGEEWVPIPAPRPFYITELNKLKALTSSKGNEHLRLEGPKNGWDYENSTALDVGMKIQDEFIRMNNFKNPDRENKKESYHSIENNEKKLKTIPLSQYFTTETNENNLKIADSPHYYSTESLKEKHKTGSIPQYYTTERNEKLQSSHPSNLYLGERNENRQNPSILGQYEAPESNLEKYRSNLFPQNTVSNFAINNPYPIGEENLERPLQVKDIPIRGKLINTVSPNSQEQYIYKKPFEEINTLIPQRMYYDDVAIKTQSLNGRLVIPSVKYGDETKNSVQSTSKPLSVFYYEQESKYQADDGYSYDVPVNPYRPEKYQVHPINQEQKINVYTSTTKKPPIYEYSYSAPGYGTLESPKVGNSIGTTQKPVPYETNFKPIKHPKFTIFEYQSSVDQDDLKFKQSTPKSTHTTPRTPVNNKGNFVKSDPYQTENPYATYHTHDLGLLDDITKKYFTLFGQKINPDNAREVTTSLPKTNQNYYEKPYYKNYDSVAPVPTKAPSSNIRFPEIYSVQSDRPLYESHSGYTTPKYINSNRKPKPVNKQNDYSYYYSPTNPDLQDYKEYGQEVVRPNHPLDSDIDVNYKLPRPNIDPDAEFIHPGYLNQAPFGNSYISYRLPGNSGHFYFLTPQAIPQHNFPNHNSRIRYRDIEKQEYSSRNVRQK